MSKPPPSPPTQMIRLTPGAQAIINGALVTAHDECSLEVGSGACVILGQLVAPRNTSLKNPRDELYFSLLDCNGEPARIETMRFRLLGLLGEVVAQDPAHEIQRECSMCVAALLAVDSRAALESAARIASSDLEDRRMRGRRSSAASGELSDQVRETGAAGNAHQGSP